MQDDNPPIGLTEFVAARDVWGRWNAARQLMADRQMQSASARPEFQQAFSELGQDCARLKGLEQLIAIALVVRISELVKGDLKKQTADFLTQALAKPPEDFWTINETRTLPPQSKPSEIREDIALALTYAKGDWVRDYVIEALAHEEKSKLCRLELIKQLLIREPSLSRCFSLLSNYKWSEISSTVDRLNKLNDIAVAFSNALRTVRNSIVVDATTAPALADLMQALVLISSRSGPPKRLLETCVATTELLDEILVTEFTLIFEADAYTPLATIYRWWQPSPYPSALERALAGIVRKLKSAITFRARLPQRSESLLTRLKQALGTGGDASAVLLSIAEQESGLNPEIDDWLRGRERKASSTSFAIDAILTRSVLNDTPKVIAPIFLDCAEAMQQSSAHSIDTPLRRICGRIEALASELKLSMVGKPGDIVEFNATLHRTVDGSIPADIHVRVLRPGVVKLRDDGSQDVVEHAIVAGSE